MASSSSRTPSRPSPLPPPAPPAGAVAAAVAAAAAPHAWWRSRAVQVVGPVALIVGGLLMLAATRLLGPPPSGKHVRFTLPKKRGSRKKRRRQEQQQGSPERRVSCLQAAWDHADIQDTYGSLDHVARLFREFGRIADGRDRTDVVWTRRNFYRLMRTAGVDAAAGDDDAGDLDDKIGSGDGGGSSGGGGGSGSGVVAGVAAQAQSLFSAIDASGAGHVTFTAFLRAFGCAMRGTREEQARFLLRLVDPGATGFVTLVGLQGYVPCGPVCAGACACVCVCVCACACAHACAYSYACACVCVRVRACVCFWGGRMWCNDGICALVVFLFLSFFPMPVFFG
jgi:hypothetical protein